MYRFRVRVKPGLRVRVRVRVKPERTQAAIIPMLKVGEEASATVTYAYTRTQALVADTPGPVSGLA